MRFLLMFLALTLAMPIEAGASPKDVAKSAVAEKATKAGVKADKGDRKIANKMPSRVLTFTCRDSEDGLENVLALTHMSISLRDSSTGAFSSSIYLRTEKGYLPKTITGTYTTVPGGFVFRTKWQGILGDFTMIHIHPAEKTAFPGMANKQICQVSGQLESL